MVNNVRTKTEAKLTDSLTLKLNMFPGHSSPPRALSSVDTPLSIRSKHSKTVGRIEYAVYLSLSLFFFGRQYDIVPEAGEMLEGSIDVE